MRGQDLLDEGRARPRQTHDEDRGVARVTPAPAGGEELRSADLDLQPGGALDELRAIADGALLQRIAALVVGERLGVLTSVLESLAEREAEMETIRDRGTRCGLRGSHGRELFVREAIGLEVREAPVGIAIARPDLCCAPVGLDRLR